MGLAKIQDIIGKEAETLATGRYVANFQFEKVSFLDDEIAPTIDTRVCASNKTFVIEIYDEDSDSEPTHMVRGNKADRGG